MQPNIKLCLAGSILVGALVHDIRTSIKIKTKASELIEENANLRSSLRLTLTQVEYLCHLLDDNDVDISEFDKIALNNPM